MYRNNRSTRVPAISLDELVLARTDTFYFLEFIEYNSNIFNANSVVSSKPSAIFYTENAEDRVILDYSLAKNEDKMYLETFFAGMIPGQTFSFTNGEYLEESKSIEANLSSTLEFVEFKGNMIFSKVSSITNQNEAIDLYSAYYFINTPQILKSTSLQDTDDTKIQALVFSNPRTAKPLLWLGYQPGDYIQILNANSVNNTKVFEILDVLFINGKEILKLKTDQIVTENLIGQNTIANLFVKSKISATINDYTNDQTDLGCCVNTTLNVALPQHTELQCALRGNGFLYNSGNCYGSLKTLISPITGDPVLSTEEKAAITDPLEQAIQTIVDPTYLSEYYKKKITIIDTTGNQLTSTNSLVTDYRATIIPVLQSSLENISAINAEQEISGVRVLTHVPKSLIQSFTELDGVTLLSESPIYKVLNIYYEVYTTDQDVLVKGLGGAQLINDAISLNKNVLTTFFETNLSTNSSERIVFSSTKEVLTPVVNFKAFGYDYLQLGRYHILTPIIDDPNPLFIYTTSLKRSQNYVSGVAAASVSAQTDSVSLATTGAIITVDANGYYPINSSNRYVVS